MTDEVFKVNKKKFGGEENPFQELDRMKKAVASENGTEFEVPLLGPDSPLKMTGNIPPGLKEMLSKRPQLGQPAMPDAPESLMTPPPTMPKSPQVTNQPQGNSIKASNEYEALLSKLDSIVVWEEITLPSLGKFYTNIPGTLHVKPMCGYEEQILTSQRFVKKGEAIDKIFEKCIQERINPRELLAIDRTYLLIFLRGISHTPEYDVEIKCPMCDFKFNELIHLNALTLEKCADNFGPENLSGILPTSEFRYTYRLPTGNDDHLVNSYKEKRLKEFGAQQEDDSALYKMALLLNDIDGVTNKQELMMVLRKLPLNDISTLRSAINVPPFGVDTMIKFQCPSCFEEFEIDLPYEASFFFPKKKKV